MSPGYPKFGLWFKVCDFMIYYYFSEATALDNHFYCSNFSLVSFFLWHKHTHTHTQTLTSPHKLHIIGFSLTLHRDWIFKFLNKEIYDKKLGKPTTWTSHPQHSSIRLVNAVELYGANTQKSTRIWRHSLNNVNQGICIKKFRVNNVWEPCTMSAWALNKHRFSFWLPMTLEVSHQPRRDGRNDHLAPSIV
jgi:hypothetical protein